MGRVIKLNSLYRDYEANDVRRARFMCLNYRELKVSAIVLVLDRC